MKPTRTIPPSPTSHSTGAGQGCNLARTGIIATALFAAAQFRELLAGIRAPRHAIIAAVDASIAREPNAPAKPGLRWYRESVHADEQDRSDRPTAFRPWPGDPCCVDMSYEDVLVTGTVHRGIITTSPRTTVPFLRARGVNPNPHSAEGLATIQFRVTIRPKAESRTGRSRLRCPGPETSSVCTF